MKTIVDVWDAEMYPADCSGRVVLDIGAHKGYFGAWALAQGAVAVFSCEPQRENYELLARCRSANVRGAAWDVQRVAVGADGGRATLFVSKGSWAHSLYEHMVDCQGTEEVTVTNPATVLDRARARCPGHEVVLKLNVAKVLRATCCSPCRPRSSNPWSRYTSTTNRAHRTESTTSSSTSRPRGCPR